MKYYVPSIQLGVLCPPQTDIEDKFGGLPWGLSKAAWPICKNCGKSMGLIAQLLHDSERLNLGRDGRCLFVFMCCNSDSKCGGTWSPEEGGNSSFVVEPEELGSGLIPPPDIADPELAEIRVWQNSAYTQNWNPENTIWIQTEVRITGWVEKDDDILESARLSFFNETEFDDISEEILDNVYTGTKLGSVPAWVQWPTHQDWRFIGQISSYFHFKTPTPDPDKIGCPVNIGILGSRRQLPTVQRFDVPREIIRYNKKLVDDNPVWGCGGPNFGDAGQGYIFIKDNGNSPPQCEFIWQCH